MDTAHLLYLRIKAGQDGSTKRIHITKFPFTIGRDPDNDLQILDTSVSRYHAKICVMPDGKYLLVDTQSKYGTHLKGSRITEHTLADGDEIIIADQPGTKITFELLPQGKQGVEDPITVANYVEPLAGDTGPLAPEQVYDPTSSLRIAANQTRFLNLELIKQVKTDPDKILRQLTSLYDLTNRMLPSTSHAELFSVWMDTLFDFLPVQCGAILLWNQAAGRFEVKLKRSSDGTPESAINISSTIANQAFQDNVAVMTVDALNDDRFAAKESLVMPRIRSVLAAPISSKLRVWGVCYLYNSNPGKFQSEDLEYLMATARAAGLVIENLRHEELAQKTEELREALAKLAETQDQLVHAEHLASLGTLTAGVAHEINNPLAAILQSVNTALERCAKVQNEELRERLSKPLQRALENGERIQRIVQDLRTFSRADRVQGEKANVRQEVEAVFHILQPLAESRQIELVADFGNLDWVEAPPTRLHQLLVNLVQNAIHASADGSRVEVHTGRAEAAENQGWIQVRDYGIGMSAETKARIFDPFFTTKPVGIGTGLGLWVCQSIIKSLNGSMQVESEVGEGTTFTLNLPLFLDGSSAS